MSSNDLLDDLIIYLSFSMISASHLAVEEFEDTIVVLRPDD
jgi:hypothetical protein